MEILPFSPATLKKAVEILKKGGVVAHPTDTCFGLAGDPKNPAAVKKIQAIKGRDGQKPMSVMFADVSSLDSWVQVDRKKKRIISKLLPGAVTIVLKKGPAVPDYFFPETPTLGVRIPDHPLTLELLRAFGGPLITTSANQSGEPATFSHKEVVDQFFHQPHQPDLVIEGRADGELPSTVIAVENGRVRMLRQGAMSSEKIKEILGISSFPYSQS